MTEAALTGPAGQAAKKRKAALMDSSDRLRQVHRIFDNIQPRQA